MNPIDSIRMALSELDKGILRDLGRSGDNIPANLADNIRLPDDGRNPHVKSVSRRLDKLEDDGLVRNKGRGVYTLTKAGAVMIDEIDGG